MKIPGLSQPTPENDSLLPPLPTLSLAGFTLQVAEPGTDWHMPSRIEYVTPFTRLCVREDRFVLKGSLTSFLEQLQRMEKKEDVREAILNDLEDTLLLRLTRDWPSERLSGFLRISTNGVEEERHEFQMELDAPSLARARETLQTLLTDKRIKRGKNDASSSKWPDVPLPVPEEETSSLLPTMRLEGLLIEIVEPEVQGYTIVNLRYRNAIVALSFDGLNLAFDSLQAFIAQLRTMQERLAGEAVLDSPCRHLRLHLQINRQGQIQGHLRLAFPFESHEIPLHLDQSWLPEVIRIWESVLVTGR
ncbi:MAG TPA: hypothetical protein PKH31_02335 [Candidatus Sumerlaeota bacterium]|nr:hypothetical protein [Candidatus Sumerlaeota bacterium]